jgi:hypothetical protein
MNIRAARPNPVSRWVVMAAVSGNVGIALGAFWLSFTALTNLASLAGVPVGEAWIWPLIVDGMIVVSTISVVALSPHGRRATFYPWGLLIAGTAVSVAANIAHAGIAADVAVSKPLAASVSAIPPIVLLASTHLTVELTRRARATPAASLLTAPHVASRLNDMPSSAPTRTTEQSSPRDVAAELREAGWSNRKIAGELGVHPSTVGRWLSSALGHVGGAESSAIAEEQGALSAR